MTENLLKVARGLRLVYIGLMIVVITVILGFIGGFVAGFAIAAQGQGAAAGGGGLVIAVALVVGVGALVGNIVGLVGRFMCLSTPPEAAGARARIMLSVIFTVCSLVGSVLAMVDVASGGFLPPVVKPIAGAVNGLMSLAASILFLLFIKSLGEFIGKRKLGTDAMSVLYMFAGAFVCYLLAIGLTVGILAAAQGGGNNGIAAFGCISLILMLAALVFALIGLVKYAKLLTNASEAVKRFAETESGVEDDEDHEYRRRYEDDRSSRRRREEPEDDLDEDRPLRRRRDDDEDDERPSRRRRDDD